MTIYILDSDPKKIPEYLDDRSLGLMIKDIAQVLCNVHYLKAIIIPLGNNQTLLDLTKNIPLPLKNNRKGLSASYDEWSQWGKECVANYDYLWRLGISCDWELAHRNDFKLSKKYHDILEWCRDNVPDLPTLGKYKPDYSHTNYTTGMTPFPLVMPKKYQDAVIEYDTSLRVRAIYRHYYQAKLKGRKCPRNCEYGRAVKANTLGYFVCEKCNGHGYMRPKWTHREKPQWLIKEN